MQDMTMYFRCSPHPWDLLLYSCALIIHRAQAAFQHGIGKGQGEGNKRTKGGGARWRETGRQGSRKTASYFKDLFFYYNLQMKMVLGSRLVFFF